MGIYVCITRIQSIHVSIHVLLATPGRNPHLDDRTGTSVKLRVVFDPLVAHCWKWRKDRITVMIKVGRRKENEQKKKS